MIVLQKPSLNWNFYITRAISLCALGPISFGKSVERARSVSGFVNDRMMKRSGYEFLIHFLLKALGSNRRNVD